jgi:Leucine-rich repeat (LRR) protein
MSDKIQEKIKEAEIDNYLDLSNLELDTVPFLPENIVENIIFLFINDNALKNIDLTSFKNLQVLDMSDNLIDEIIFLPSTLEELVCNNCCLKKICYHPTIKRIHCNNNNLSHIEPYPQITNLQCGNNKLESIPSLPKIMYLICHENPIKQIGNCPNLIDLDCETTLLEGKITFAPMLRYLMCCNTKISDIFDLQELKEIEFYNCNITKLPYLPKLKSIIINNTNINLSAEYKIIKIFNMGSKFNIIFE